MHHLARLSLDLRSRRVALVLGLAAVLGGWFWLALGPQLIGPSDWDDTMYAERALTGAFVWDVRNRYVHVWALRVIDSLLPSHRLAGAAWGALCVCGLAGLAFFAGKRIAGLWAGWLALVACLVFPPMLKYLSVPHVDFTVALFGVAAVVAAVVAVETPSTRHAWIAALLSGLCGFLALKSKETGLVAPPLAAFVLIGAARGRGQRLGVWLVGLTLGLALLFALDQRFAPDAKQRASDLRHYFSVPKEAPTKLSAGPRSPKAVHSDEVLDLMTRPAFLAFTLLGCAGLARHGRRSAMARVLGLWALSVLAFTALVSFRSRGVDAQDRYVIAAGATLAPLAAAWVVGLVREPIQRTSSLFYAGLLVAVAGPALWGLWYVHLGQPSVAQARAAQLLTPLGLLLLFLAAFFVQRWLAAACALLLLVVSSLLGLDDAASYRAMKRHELAPWLALAERVDHASSPPRIAVLRGHSYHANRLRWRLRVLSRQPTLRIHVRDIQRVEQVDDADWVFVGQAREMRERELEGRKFEQVLSLDADPRPWTLYSRAIP
ncbi:MAG: hypothetical protein ABW321_04510 [Polyangiales bacterium]